jgi:hypothetical protein
LSHKGGVLFRLSRDLPINSFAATTCWECLVPLSQQVAWSPEFVGKAMIRITTEREAEQDENGKTIPGSPETIPARYNTESTLSFTVEPNKRNVANFDLQLGRPVTP